ncbi:MAG: cupin domain-containing protein [Cryomorphaceae bacterium]|nr:cupin domain-containing protein [Cryomorphaceae bacterium]
MKTIIFTLLLPSVLLTSCQEPTDNKKEPQYRQWKKQRSKRADQKKGLYLNISDATNDNYDYRSILYTGKFMQLGLMSLERGEDTGWDSHRRSDQLIRVESGNGLCLMNDEEYKLSENDALFIPAGAEFNILNENDSIQFKFYVVYAQPVFKDGISRSTKEEAGKKKEKYDGRPTE